MTARVRPRRTSSLLSVVLVGAAIIAAAATASLAAPGDLDDDGLLDVAEDANTDADNNPITAPGPDTDGDSNPDYLDADDDGDGIPTALENADPNGDGDPRDALDSDRDGQPDWLDPQPVASTAGYVVGEQLISGIAGGLTGPIGNFARFGHAVASIGDLDGDGINDVAVGAYNDGDGGLGRGSVFILFLNADGTVKAEQKISDTVGGLSAPLADGDWFGFSLGAPGDLDGDGLTDLAVGAVYDDDGGTNRGAVFVLFLNADGTVRAEQKISNTIGGFTGILDDDDGFGSSLASIGDLDGDGIGDLAAGAYDDDGGTNQGAIYVLFMNADGTVKAQQKISPSVGGGPGLDNNDYFGIGVDGIGDIDGDGVIDLAVGSQGDDDGGQGRGAVYILFMNTDGTARARQKLSELSGGLSGFDNDYTSFGSSIAGVGDLDDDGVPDLVVGGDSADGAGNARGAAFVLMLDAAGTVKAEWEIGDGVGGLTGPLGDNDRFGSSVASLGDLDGDGTLGLAVGAWQAEAGGSGRGEVFILDLGPSAVTVNSTGDAADAAPGDHLCDTGGSNVDGDPECTLRAAIEEANASIPVDTIEFAVPLADPGHLYHRDDGLAGSLAAPVPTTLADAAVADFDLDYPVDPFSWWDISVTGPLPPITTSVTIDGTTQTGWRPNKATGGAATDAVLPIVITGDSINLMDVQGSATTLRGLNVSGADPSATVVLLRGGGGHTFEGGWAQMSPVGNDNGPGDDGIYVAAGSNGNTIGGPDPEDRVLIGNGASNSGLWLESNSNVVRNVWVGVQVTGDAGLPSYNDLSVVVNGDDNVLGTPGAGLVVTDALNALLDITGDRNVVQGGIFGPVADGSLPATAQRDSVSISGSDNLVGGVGGGERNIIVGQDGGAALRVSAGSGNSLLGNLIRQVGGLHIELSPPGVNNNDPGDGDIGANDLLNHPILIGSSTSGGTLTLDFSLDLPAGGYRVEFFADTTVQPSSVGHGAGEALVGSATVSHTGGGIQTFQATMPDVGNGWLAATVTEDLGGGDYGSTSEFGAIGCVGDVDGDGLCDLWEDADTDADGDPTTTPGPNTDGDGLVNYLDADDDGDGIQTGSENADPNGDANPRDAIDGDRDGEPDYLDIPTSRTEGTAVFAQKISATSGGLVDIPLTEDLFGSDVASVGDLDGDGIVDLVVGIPEADDGGTNRGAVIVLFMNADGTVKAEQRISHSAGGGPGLDDGDLFGISVAGLGDLDGDGIADMVVGARDDDDGATDAGAVWILLLDRDGTVSSSQKISATNGLVWAPAYGDRFGISVGGIGDLDGDGVKDLIVGADRSDDGSWDWGAVHIVFLNADGTPKADRKISAISGGLGHSFDPGVDEEFGSSVAGIGDVDGDGLPDVAVGSVRFSGDGSQRGAVHILFLNADGTVKAEQRISDAAGNLTTPLPFSGWFGVSVSGVGDLDLDGTPDLLVGSETYVRGAVDGGAVFLLNLNPDGTVKAERLIDATAPALAGAIEPADSFGSGVAGLGDLDGDGRIDLAIGAFGDDDGGTASGAIYVLSLAPGNAVVNSTGDAVDLVPGDRICDTGGTNATGAPECTLRAAIAESNAAGIYPEVLFDIPVADAGHAAGTWTIVPATALPDVTGPVALNATSQPGWTADPVVVLNGAATPPATNGVTLRDAGRSSVVGIEIVDFPGNGVQVLGASEVAILGNRIYGNGGLGIDLGADGVTPNDGGDVDAGPNELLNAPVLTSARASGSSVTVSVELDLPVNLDGYRVELFANPSGADASGYGEGEVLLGTMDAAGSGAAYSFVYGGASNDVISASITAIRGAGFGATSEFSEVVIANYWPVPDLAAVDIASLDTEMPSVGFPASDADNDVLTWSASGLPPGLSIDPGTGEVSGGFVPGAVDVAYDAEITVSDGRGGTATWNFTWTVVAVNDPPSIAPIAPVVADELAPLLLQPVATDPEGHNLRFRMDAGPAGATIDPNTGAVRWTPGETDGPGQHTIVVTTTDDGVPALSATLTVVVTVAEVNSAPTLIIPSRRSVIVGEELSLQLSAIDTDQPANGLRYRLISGPAEMSVDPLTGVVRWAPNAVSPGFMAVTVEVIDDGSPALAGRAVFQIAAVEALPESIPFAPGSEPELVDDWYVATYRATMIIDPLDNDRGDGLQLISVESPPGVEATIEDGLISIRFGTSIAGRVSLVYVVADGSGRTASGTITVDVEYPELGAVDDEANTSRDSPIRIDLRANDLHEGQVLRYEIDDPEFGSVRVLGSGVIEYTPDPGALGLDRFVYRITDGFGATSVASVAVEVTAIALTEPVADALDIELPPRSSATRMTNERLSLVDIGLGTIGSLTALRISRPLVVGSLLSLLVFLFIVWWWFAPGVILAATNTRRNEQVAILDSDDEALFRLRGDADLVWAPRDGGPLRRIFRRFRSGAAPITVVAPDGTPGQARSDRLTLMVDAYESGSEG